MVYSTLLGGAGDDIAHGVAVDSAGNAYVSGFTGSTNFPLTPGALQSNLLGSEDAFVAKINPQGTALVFSTLLGGTRSERAPAIAVDPGGNVYVVGATVSRDFPVSATAATPRFAGGPGDAFIAKLNFTEQNLDLAVAPAGLTFLGLAGSPLASQPVTVTAAAGVAVAWTASATSTGGSWLSVTPKAGTGSGTLKAAVDPTGLAPGSYTGSITIANQVTGATSAVQVALTLTKPPDPGGQISPDGVVNAASFQGGPVAPGEMVTIFGSGIGPRHSRRRL